MTLGERRVAGESAGQQREGEGWEAGLWVPRETNKRADPQPSLGPAAELPFVMCKKDTRVERR